MLQKTKKKQQKKQVNYCQATEKRRFVTVRVVWYLTKLIIIIINVESKSHLQETWQIKPNHPFESL